MADSDQDGSEAAARWAAAEAFLRFGMGLPPVRDLFGIDLVEWEPGSVTLALDHRAELGHAPGWFQGAITCALAEYAAGLAAGTAQPQANTMTQQQNIHFTGPARGERLVAHGRVLATGRSVTTSIAEVWAEREGQRTPCATMTMTSVHQLAKV